MNAMLKIGDVVGYVEREAVLDLTPSENCRWYVVQTEPSREMTAQANLIMRKVPFYMPTMLRAAYLSKQAHSAGVSRPDVVRPLFPGILFIAETVIEARYETICRTPGVAARPFWRYADAHAVLAPDQMQVVRYIEAGERELYERSKDGKAIGYEPAVHDRVRILLNTTIDGMSGRVSEIDDRGRITLLVEIMKRQVRVQVTADQITPV